jgi:hypothetical protein
MPGEKTRSQPQPSRVALPRFVSDEEIGLGDVVKRATSYLGIKPCSGCDRRARALNHRVVFTKRAK